MGKEGVFFISCFKYWHILFTNTGEVVEEVLSGQEDDIAGSKSSREEPDGKDSEVEEDG